MFLDGLFNPFLRFKLRFPELSPDSIPNPASALQLQLSASSFSLEPSAARYPSEFSDPNMSISRFYSQFTNCWKPFSPYTCPTCPACPLSKPSVHIFSKFLIYGNLLRKFHSNKATRAWTNKFPNARYEFLHLKSP